MCSARASISARTAGSPSLAARTSPGTSSTSLQPGISHSAQNVPKLMFISTCTGIVSATTRPPTSRAHREGPSWRSIRRGWPAAMLSTFQLSGRFAIALIWARRSFSASVKPFRQPSTIASSVVPSCSPTTAQSSSSSWTEANRLATGLPSPSECVEDRVVESPRPPELSDSCKSAAMACSSRSLASRSVAAPPITYRRSAQCPTRNPAFTAMRPSSPSRYWPKDSQPQSAPVSSAGIGMPSTRAIIRRM